MKRLPKPGVRLLVREFQPGETVPDWAFLFPKRQRPLNYSRWVIYEAEQTNEWGEIAP